jgi:hypothetical protein
VLDLPGWTAARQASDAPLPLSELLPCLLHCKMAVAERRNKVRPAHFTSKQQMLIAWYHAPTHGRLADAGGRSTATSAAASCQTGSPSSRPTATPPRPR